MSSEIKLNLVLSLLAEPSTEQASLFDPWQSWTNSSKHLQLLIAAFVPPDSCSCLHSCASKVPCLAFCSPYPPLLLSAICTRYQRVSANKSLNYSRFTALVAPCCTSHQIASNIEQATTAQYCEQLLLISSKSANISLKAHATCAASIQTHSGLYVPDSREENVCNE